MAVCWLIVEPPRMTLPPPRVAPHRRLDRLAVEAGMGAELAVLAGDHRADHVAVDPPDRHPFAPRAAAADHVAQLGEGDGRVHEAVGKHPEQADDEEEQHALDQPEEDADGERAAGTGGHGRRISRGGCGRHPLLFARRPPMLRHCP